MNKLNELLQELGISKVRLAKYLGVSRQMVYNYLELDDINKWPKEKKILLFKLLDIQDSKDIENVDITTDYLMNVENRLNQSIKSNASEDAYLDIKNLNKDAQNLLSDMFNPTKVVALFLLVNDSVNLFILSIFVIPVFDKSSVLNTVIFSNDELLSAMFELFDKYNNCNLTHVDNGSMFFTSLFCKYNVFKL